MHKLSLVVPTLAAALGLSFAASAQIAPPTVGTSTSSSQHVDAPAALSSKHSAMKSGDRDCLQHTGSLIPPKKGECMPVVGRSYSGAELRRTGRQDTGRALQMLDPSISIGH